MRARRGGRARIEPTDNMSRASAQTRADRIRAFREELAELERAGVVELPAAQREGLRRYHDETLQALARDYDVDTTAGQKQLSWGMRVASLLGALALCAAVFLFFFRYWGLLSTATQVIVLVGAPVLGVLGTEAAARRERTMYVAGIVGLVAFGGFVLDLAMLGSIFNVTPSPRAFLAWAAFAFCLAYAYGLRILLVAGILSLAGYLSATMGTWRGLYWLSFGERPENFFPVALLLLAMALARHGRHDFPPLYRIFGLLGLLLPILVLSNWGALSYLALPTTRVEHLYQAAAFVVAAATIGAGVRLNLREVTNVGSTFFIIFLYTRFFDWWWDWMPKYLFFLVVGAFSIAVLLTLQRLRRIRSGGGA
jgi:uncharacterized membrane protein